MSSISRRATKAILPVSLFCGMICIASYMQTTADARKSMASVPPDTRDSELVRALLGQDLPNRTFSFSTVVHACSGKDVIPLDHSPAHARVIHAIETALAECLPELSGPRSPVRKLTRVQDAARCFEEAIRGKINTMPGLTCEPPSMRPGTNQRAAYPDLRIFDHESNVVFYLDPKLLEQGSTDRSFRTFYFEPKNETLKINDDAVHLLVGIEHDGRNREWTFTGWRIVDLSTLQVKLKAEFQASNAELYRETGLSLPDPAR